MLIQKCDNCIFREQYDNNPKSFLGRIWRWHTKYCPGWKRYIKSLPDEERAQLAEKYDMEKFK